MSSLTYTRVVAVTELRPLTRAYVPMRDGGHAWLCVTSLRLGARGAWQVEGTDADDRHLTSAWSDAPAVEVW